VPKERMQESRFDFRGGWNTMTSSRSLNPNELVLGTNARLSKTHNGFSKRLGTRRMHLTAITGGVKNVIQSEVSGTGLAWTTVAIGNGDLFWKQNAYGNFSSISPTPAFGNIFTGVHFMEMRDPATNGQVELWIGDGVNVHRLQSPATLSNRTTFGANVPTSVDLIANYHTRAIWRDDRFLQKIIWSVLGDPDDGTVGLEDQGGEAQVSAQSADKIQQFAVVGSSLLLATNNSISRYTGYSTRDIQIEQDTEGITADHGCVGPLAFLAIEDLAIAMDKRDVFAINEQQILPIGTKIRPEIIALDRSKTQAIVVGYHPGLREVWIAVPGAGDSGLNKTVFVYSMELGAWMGPWTYPFGITCFAPFADLTTRDESLMSGATDGFVRHMDTGTQDDVLADASGGTDYTMTVEPSPVMFQTGPGQVKTLERVLLEAEVPSGTNLIMKHAFDTGALTSKTIAGVAGGVQDYRVDAHDQGKILRLQWEVTTAALVTVHGYNILAFDMQRN